MIAAALAPIAFVFVVLPMWAPAPVDPSDRSAPPVRSAIEALRRAVDRSGRLSAK